MHSSYMQLMYGKYSYFTNPLKPHYLCAGANRPLLRGEGTGDEASLLFFFPICYRFITLWSTLLSCFGIRMSQSYWNVAKFLEVCGLGKCFTFLTFGRGMLCKLQFHQQGYGKSCLLYLPVWSAIVCQAEVAVKFVHSVRITLNYVSQNYVDLT